MSDTPRQAVISGEGGYLTIAGPYYQPGPFTMSVRGKQPLTFNDTTNGHKDGLHFSAVEAARQITSGATQSAVHPPADVVSTLRTMDRIRAEIGIRYPGEF